MECRASKLKNNPKNMGSFKIKHGNVESTSGAVPPEDIINIFESFFKQLDDDNEENIIDERNVINLSSYCVYVINNSNYNVNSHCNSHFCRRNGISPQILKKAHACAGCKISFCRQEGNTESGLDLVHTKVLKILRPPCHFIVIDSK